ncbi:tRNA (guanine-N(7)-)-methyltransferase non-catalytic subunit wdr4 [Galdieria sulphuraria]|nr:tRNA (guanine-N(7)-)-methyltransferase non-catalytic subunit wdr4 [Galdieria sulphuraria]
MSKETGNICVSLIESHKTLPLLVLVTNLGLLVFEVSSSKLSWVSKDVRLMEQVVCVAFSQQTTPLRLAVVTNDKWLLVFESQDGGSGDSWKLQLTKSFRKRPSCLVFSNERNPKVLVADKSGLVHTVSLSEETQSSSLVEPNAEEDSLSNDEDDWLGHYATIVAMNVSMNGEYVITVILISL